MHVASLSGALGADILGIDVSRSLDDSTFAAVHDALVRYGVIVVRELKLTAREQFAFVQRFNPIHLHPHVSGLPDVPEIMEALKTEEQTSNFGSEWHTGQSFLEHPAMATCFYAREIPAAGVDTRFTCLRGGYRALSPGLKRIAHGLRTVNLSVAAQFARRDAENTVTYASMRTRSAYLSRSPRSGL